MADFIVCILVLLAIAVPSEAPYCVCNGASGDTAALQRNIDYSCANGADCSAILQNGACYNPNTLRDHCNYAVNSYYQRRAEGPGTCDFSGTANITQTAPSAASGCVYQASPSNGGGTSPPSNTPPTGNTTNPGGTFPGSPMTPGVNTLTPPGSTFGDGSAGVTLIPSQRSIFMLMSFAIFVCFLA